MTLYGNNYLCTVLNAETNGTKETRAKDNSNAASQSTLPPSSTSAGEEGSEGGRGELRDGCTCMSIDKEIFDTVKSMCMHACIIHQIKARARQLKNLVTMHYPS